MTPTTPADELGADQRLWTDDFLDLLLADTDWVDAEFDAIIAASWNPDTGNTRFLGRLPTGGSWPRTDPPMGTTRRRHPRLGAAATTAAQRRGRGPPQPDVVAR